jgi:hypothetical protein
MHINEVKMHRGRPPGLKNRLQTEFAERYDDARAKTGFDLIDTMMWLGVDVKQRLQTDNTMLPDWRISYSNLLVKICQSILPYKYPKMQAIQLKIDDGPSVGQILDERINEILGISTSRKDE